jgi:hypothetical protein
MPLCHFATLFTWTKPNGNPRAAIKINNGKGIFLQDRN